MFGMLGIIAPIWWLLRWICKWCTAWVNYEVFYDAPIWWLLKWIRKLCAARVNYEVFYDARKNPCIHTFVSDYRFLLLLLKMKVSI